MIRMRAGMVVGLLLYSIVMRVLPYVLARFGLDINPETTTYPWNFSPLPAICLFGGACFAERRWAYIVPLGAFLLGDVGIWAVTGRTDWAFYSTQPVVYGSIVLIVALGHLVRRHRTVPAIAGTGLLASTLFFLLTNFAVWALGDGSRYSLTAAGLLECYVMALPFFRNSLISMAVFSTVLFSPLVLARHEQSALQPVPAGDGN